MRVRHAILPSGSAKAATAMPAAGTPVLRSPSGPRATGPGRRDPIATSRSRSGPVTPARASERDVAVLLGRVRVALVAEQRQRVAQARARVAGANDLVDVAQLGRHVG